MDGLLEHLETSKSLYRISSPHLTAWIELVWGKLNKYYSLTAFHPVLYAAVALHPAMKFEYFAIARADHPDWIDAGEEISYSLAYNL